MENLNDVKENLESLTDNLASDLDMKRLKDELLIKYKEYQTTIKLMACDAPIAILCLSPKTEKILLSNGCLRVYDILEMDLTKIVGLTEVAARDLTSRLDQFRSML